MDAQHCDFSGFWDISFKKTATYLERNIPISPSSISLIKEGRKKAGRLIKVTSYIRKKDLNKDAYSPQVVRLKVTALFRKFDIKGPATYIHVLKNSNILVNRWALKLSFLKRETYVIVDRKPLQWKTKSFRVKKILELYMKGWAKHHDNQRRGTLMKISNQLNKVKNGKD